MNQTLTDTTYQPCAQCGAPLDDAQRYCVFCGASRHHAADPVALYLGAARQRPASSAPPTAVAERSSRSDRWLVLALALLPLVAAGGVLVGRGSSGNDTLLEALRAQKAPIVQVGTVGAGAKGASTSAGADGAATTAAAKAFPLAKGYTVQLKTLPSGSAANAAIAAARKKGAKDVGVLDPAAVDLSPDPGGKLVLYSGAFRTRARAEKALAGLKHDFAGAKVVSVRRSASGDENADEAVVAKHPTAKQKAEGAEIVKQIQATKGKKYVDQQRKLPDTIVVP